MNTPMNQEIPFRYSEPFSSNRPPRDTPNILDNIPLPTDLLTCVAPLHEFPYTEVGEASSVSQKTVSAESLRDEVQAAVNVVEMEFGPEPPCGTVHGLATIRVYSGKTMFSVVNSALRSSQRSEAFLKPLLPFLKLLLHTLRSLPAEYRYQGTVYRCESGAHPNFATRYQRGRKTAFYGFASCTTNPAVLTEFGSRGAVRTVFHLDVTRAYRIDAFSNFADEAEVLLEPCATFEVTDSKIYSDEKAVFMATSVWNDNMEGLHEVKAKQVKSVYELLRLEAGESEPQSALTCGVPEAGTPTANPTVHISIQQQQQQQPQPQPQLQQPAFPLATPAPSSPSPTVPHPPSQQPAPGSSSVLQPPPPPLQRHASLKEGDNECIAQIMDACGVDNSTAVNVYLAENRNIENAINAILGLAQTTSSAPHTLQHHHPQQPPPAPSSLPPSQMPVPATLTPPPPSRQLAQGGVTNGNTHQGLGTGLQPRPPDHCHAVLTADDKERITQIMDACSVDEATATNVYLAENKNLDAAISTILGLDQGCHASGQQSIWTSEPLTQDADPATISQFNTAVMYDRGDGVPRNGKLAVEYYEKAANNGLIAAMCNLGNMYHEGRGVPRDLKRAIEWYEKAAQLGQDFSQYRLAVAYATGEGVPQNETLAVQWYERAAEQGLAVAQHNLGNMYANGRGVARDQQKAAFWWEKAASNQMKR